MVIAIYGDYLFVTETLLKVIKQFEEDMSKKFEMSDLRKLTYYLDIEVIKREEKQERYAQEIMCDAKMEACNMTHILMESILNISKPEDEPEINATDYRRII